MLDCVVCEEGSGQVVRVFCVDVVPVQFADKVMDFSLTVSGVHPVSVEGATAWTMPSAQGFGEAVDDHVCAFLWIGATFEEGVRIVEFSLGCAEEAGAACFLGIVGLSCGWWVVGVAAAGGRLASRAVFSWSFGHFGVAVVGIFFLLSQFLPFVGVVGFCCRFGVAFSGRRRWELHSLFLALFRSDVGWLLLLVLSSLVVRCRFGVAFAGRRRWELLCFLLCFVPTLGGCCCCCWLCCRWSLLGVVVVLVAVLWLTSCG